MTWLDIPLFKSSEGGWLGQEWAEFRCIPMAVLSRLSPL